MAEVEELELVISIIRTTESAEPVVRSLRSRRRPNQPIGAKDETSTGSAAFVEAFRVWFAPYVRILIDLPKDDDLPVFALAHRSANPVRLRKSEPVGRELLGRRQQEKIHPTINPLGYEVARRPRCVPRGQCRLSRRVGTCAGLSAQPNFSYRRNIDVKGLA